MWFNVHYGYVGMAAGIPPDVLLSGASFEEGVGKDDQGDQITMRAGIEMYQRYGDDLTKEQFHQKVMETVQEMKSADVKQVEDWKPRDC